MDKCREGYAVFCMEHKVTEAPFYWKLWQAAWNARQPEAKMLDLGGLESHPIVEWYTMWGASDEEALVRYSDLTDKLLPTVVGREELARLLIERFGAVHNHLSWYEVADAILDRISGVK